MIHKQHFNFYIASCLIEGKVLFCEFDNGTAKVLDKTPVDRPMYMLKNDKMHVLLRDPGNKNESNLVTFSTKDGFINRKEKTIPTQGSVACHLCSLDGNIYCVNYLSGNVVKLPDTVVTHEGSSINPMRQSMSHTHYINSFDGKYLLCTDLGTDTIHTYDKELNEISKVKVPAGHGPRHLEYLNGKVYCLNELMSTISVFEYQDGILTLQDTKSVVPDNCTDTYAAAIRTNGSYIYASNRGHDSISVLKPVGNSIQLVETVSCGGNSPRDFNIFGNILICANEASDNVTFFELKDGIPQKLNLELKVNSPVCVI